MDEKPLNKGNPDEMPKRIHIKTYGCQMNVYDSERIFDTMGTLGYKETEEMIDADLIVLNTCHIREKAVEKVYSDLGRIRKLKAKRTRDGKKTIVAVAGCVAQAEGAEIQRRAPIVDIVVGPQSFQNLTHLVFRAQQEGTHIIDTNFPSDGKFANLPAKRNPKSCTAFLTIQEGCDKFCTFCVVPYTRGAEFSRPVERIESEVRQLAEAGVREITLLGQNVNAYHGEGRDGAPWSLGRLIDAVSEIEGLERIRYTTSHPRDMDDELIAVHRDNSKLMPYLHLPVQSGSDRILEAMNRKHSAAEYHRVIERIRRARPDIALSSDFIVGFPGETDADFEATMALVRAVEYAQAYSFKYSPRPGTPAADRDDQVAEEVKAERLRSLQELLNEQQAAFNRACVGRRMKVLFDRSGRKPGQLVGRSPFLQAVHVDAPEHHFGALAAIEITQAGPNSLSGKLAQDAGYTLESRDRVQHEELTH